MDDNDNVSILVEFSMFPTDKGESVSSYVSRIIGWIDRCGLSYQLTPMGTVVECATIHEATHVIEMAYEQLIPDCNRIYSSIKMDIRKGKSDRLKQKIVSVEQVLGKKVSV